MKLAEIQIDPQAVARNITDTVEDTIQRAVDTATQSAQDSVIRRVNETA